MKQIVIEQHIRNIAKAYCNVLRRKGVGRYQTPEKRLIDFENYLRNVLLLPNYADYIKQIRCLYSIVIRLQPEYYERFHRRYFEEMTHNCKHSKKCTFYTLRFGCSFAAVNTIKPQLL